MKKRFTFTKPNNAAKRMHTSKIFAASCFIVQQIFKKKLQMTPGHCQWRHEVIVLAR